MFLFPYKVIAVKTRVRWSSGAGILWYRCRGDHRFNYPIIATFLSNFLASGIVVEQLDKNVNSEYSEYNPSYRLMEDTTQKKSP
jgi:hypothetical protein